MQFTRPGQLNLQIFDKQWWSILGLKSFEKKTVSFASPNYSNDCRVKTSGITGWDGHVTWLTNELLGAKDWATPQWNWWGQAILHDTYIYIYIYMYRCHNLIVVRYCTLYWRWVGPFIQLCFLILLVWDYLWDRFFGYLWVFVDVIEKA